MPSQKHYVAGLMMVVLAGAAQGQGHAQPSQPNAVAATAAWSRATPPGAQTAAVYLTLKSAFADKLVAISTPAAKTAQVHSMTMDGNVMRMRDVTNLDLPAGQPVSLQPGGYHIMLEGLAAPLKRGQTIPLHLTFQKSAPIDVQAVVATMGATTAPQN